MEELMNRFTAAVGADILSVAKAIGCLIVGWIFASLLAAFVRGALRKTSIDNQIAEWFAGKDRMEEIDLEAWIGRIVYYGIMLFAIVAALQALSLTAVTEPLNALLNQVMAYLPRLGSAAVLIAVALLLASGVRMAVTKALSASQFEKRFLEETEAGGGHKSVAETVGEALYWFIVLLFLPGILGTLELQGMMQPVQGMMNEVVGFLPNLLTAGITLAVGWLIAKIVQRIVTSFAAAAGLDSLSERFGSRALLAVRNSPKYSGRSSTSLS